MINNILSKREREVVEDGKCENWWVRAQEGGLTGGN